MFFIQAKIYHLFKLLPWLPRDDESPRVECLEVIDSGNMLLSFIWDVGIRGGGTEPMFVGGVRLGWKNGAAPLSPPVRPKDLLKAWLYVAAANKLLWLFTSLCAKSAAAAAYGFHKAAAADVGLAARKPLARLLLLSGWRMLEYIWLKIVAALWCCWKWSATLGGLSMDGCCSSLSAALLLSSEECVVELDMDLAGDLVRCSGDLDLDLFFSPPPMVEEEEGRPGWEVLWLLRFGELWVVPFERLKISQ